MKCELKTVKQYEMTELAFKGGEPEGSAVTVDLQAVFSHGEKAVTVKGFYAGESVYKVRFLPEETGIYPYCVTGSVLDEPMEGTLEVMPAEEGRHGIVRANGTHLQYEDGGWYYPFGTTVYALMHQSEPLIEETLDTLSKSPFNKIRTCVFPKHYIYNLNEPANYPFLQKAGAAEKIFSGEGLPVYPQEIKERDDYWDVHRPNYAFWDHMEKYLFRLHEMGIQIDLILFHSYDRWGFSNLKPEDNLVYLDYLMRRLAAFPNIWWSLANEYDLCFNKCAEDWEVIEAFVAEHDSYGHLLSNHNCFKRWDPGRKNITHTSWQSKQFYRISEMMRLYGKPVLIDECRYEGNVPEVWGNLSGEDMTRNFWRTTVQGGYCTHGETFLPGTKEGEKATRTGEKDVVWWAKGGRLNGESPARIAFLKEIIESLPGPLEPMNGRSGWFGKDDDEILEICAQAQEGFRVFLKRIVWMDQRERDNFYSVEFQYGGHCGDRAFLYYKDDQCCAMTDLELPKDHSYQVDVIDTWEMTRKTVLHGASGNVRIQMPGKKYMAVLALREDID